MSEKNLIDSVVEKDSKPPEELNLPLEPEKPKIEEPAKEADLSQLLGAEPVKPILPPITDAPATPLPAIPPTAEQPKRGRGRPPGSGNKPRFDDLQIQPEQQSTVNFAATAELLVDMATGGAATVLGPEWNPRGPEEKKMVVDATANYLKAKDIKDLPPGVVLCFVIAAYSLPRMSQPKTKEKIAMGWTWFKMKIFGRRSEKPANVFSDPKI